MLNIAFCSSYVSFLLLEQGTHLLPVHATSQLAIDQTILGCFLFGVLGDVMAGCRGLHFLGKRSFLQDAAATGRMPPWLNVILHAQLLHS
jgi:hypothetical protein